MRIYIACLASYNAGCLVGEWRDVSTDPDENAAAIAEVLKASPIKGAEEWAIHDYEAPRAIADLLGENPGFDTLAGAARIFEEVESEYPDSDDVEAVLGVMLDGVQVSDLADFDASDWLRDRAAGKGDTLADWAGEFAEETGMFEGLPDDSPLRVYFDAESYARDMLLGGDVITARGASNLLVFWAR